MTSSIPVRCSTKWASNWELGSSPGWVWVFFRPYFRYYIYKVHYCEDHFHTFHETRVHIYDFHLFQFIRVKLINNDKVGFIFIGSWPLTTLCGGLWLDHIEQFATFEGNFWRCSHFQNEGQTITVNPLLASTEKMQEKGPICVFLPLSKKTRMSRTICRCHSKSNKFSLVLRTWV